MGFLEEHKQWAPMVLRLFLGVGFLVAGLDKLANIGVAKDFFVTLFGTGTGVYVLYLVIAIELLGGLALLFGFKVCFTSCVLGLMILVAFIKTFALGATTNFIGTLREIMVMNTGGGNTAVNYAYFAGLLSLAYSGSGSAKRMAAMPAAPKPVKKRNRKKRK